MNIFDKINTSIDQADKLAVESHPFYSFEPWDISERPDWIKQRALDDGIDLYSNDLIRHTGSEPRLFQAGFILCTKNNANVIAASQVGKTYPAIMKAIMMMTGELPFAFRYDKGFDTGIERVISPMNIRRFGRISRSSLKVIDYNENGKRSEDWFCGTIKGAGVFPQELIAPAGEEVRVGVYQRLKTEVWWPRLAEARRLIVPEHLIDRTRGNNGYNKKDGQVYLIRNSLLSIITYEMEATKFEGDRCWYTILDEEPPNKNIIGTVVTHTKRWSLHETPYKGITYSREVFFPKEISPDSQTFHATAYDCPYKTVEEINIERSKLSNWEIGARIWGIPTELKGSPYFDRKKVNNWIQKYARFIPYKWAEFLPSQQYHGIVSRPDITAVSGLLDTPIKMLVTDQNNDRTTWRIYEERQAGTAYVFSGDPAEGALIPDEAGDISAGLIMRPADHLKKEIRPVIVASLRSTLETIPFAKTVSYALRYYNNALFAPETKGSASATMANELKDWPYWYMHTSTQDSTGNAREKKGFDTTSKSRDSIFDLIKEWVLEFEEGQYPYIPDEPLLVELAQAVVSKTQGGKQRCDHTDQGTLDSTICFGVLLYLFKNAPDQVKCNYMEPTKQRVDRNPRPQKQLLCNMSCIGYGGAS
jgi:hypothetical protein